MGIQLGALKFKGKFNDSVGFTNGNAKSEATRYAVRNRVTQISNPKTSGQAGQRVKLAPAQNFYRALAMLLDHSWEGVKYGGRSYSEFLKRAMLMSEGFPYVIKGTKEAWPGEYVIADGSLAPVGIYRIEETYVTTEIAFTGSWQGATIGEISANIISQNSNLKDGDQITFIMGYLIDNQPAYMYTRLILDTTNTGTYGTEDGFTLYKVADKLSFMPVSNDVEPVAAAVIISRPPRNAGGAWQRSFSQMKVADSIKHDYMSEIAKHRAVITYMIQKSSTSSSYYLNEGGDETPEAPVTQVEVTIEKEGQGTVEGAGRYVPGSEVIVEATAADNYEFVRWEIAGQSVSTDEEYSFIAATNVTLTAIFMAVTPP